MAAFLDATGWGDTPAVPLAGDASFRRYYRLGCNGNSAVLMDAPPPQEDMRPLYRRRDTIARARPERPRGACRGP